MMWLLPISGTLSSFLHSLAHCLVTTLAFLLFWEQVKFVSASGLLHLQFFLPGVIIFLIFPQSAPTHLSNHSCNIISLRIILRLLHLNLK